MSDDDLTRLPDEEPKSSLLSEGQTFGQYKVIRLLGRGGMGEVYEVENPVLEKRYALKLLNKEIMSRPDAAERFKREAKVMARFEHPNIVKVDDFGEIEGHSMLRMELISGWDHEGKAHHSLQSLLSESGALPESLVSQFIEQILKGMGAAHDFGAIHRDLKPANLLLDAKGDVKVTDFGLVSLAGADWLQSQVQLTVARSMADPDATRMEGDAHSGGSSTKALLGTYAYMSPEQKKGAEVDARSDLYAVTLIAFQMLTGEETLGLEMPSDIVDGLDASWDDWIKRGIATRPERRFQTTYEMLNELPGRGVAVEGMPPLPTREVVEREQLPQKREVIESKQLPSEKDIFESELAFPQEKAVKVKQAIPTPKGPLKISTKSPIESGKDFEINFGGVATLSMKWIAPGKFTMGSPKEIRKGGLLGVGGQIIQKCEHGRANCEIQHKVTLSHGYWLGATPTTQAQWRLVMKTNPSHFKGEDLPVERVTWEESMEFCCMLEEMMGAEVHLPKDYSYSLPTEVEWEYACRAGTTGAYAGVLDDMGWYYKNSARSSHPVGGKQPNAWGLYDMHGNISEWCLDKYGDYPSGSVVDPKRNMKGKFRVKRGGCWSTQDYGTRSAHRGFATPGYRQEYVGFRLAIAPLILR